MAVSKQTLAAGGVVLGGGAAAGGAIISKQQSSEEKVTFGEKLKEHKILKVTNEDDKEAWKHKAQTLKDFVESSSQKLETKLKEVKGKIKDLGTTWTELRDWCKDVYGKEYSDGDIWNLSKKFCTKPTIGEALHGTELKQTDATFDTEWGKEADRAKAGSASEALKALIPDTETTDNTKVKAIKKWCKDSYEKDFDVDLEDKSGTKLLTEVQKWCVYTIKEKITDTDSSKILNAEATGNTNESDWKTLVKNLNKRTDTDPALTPELVKIQNKTNQETDAKWTELRDWCKETYEKSYEGPTNNLWKLADKFCRKA